MRSTPLENRIAEIAAAADMGLEIVSVKILGEGGGTNVQVLAENPATKNLGVEDCTKLSKALSAVRCRGPDQRCVPSRGQLAGHRPPAGENRGF